MLAVASLVAVIGLYAALLTIGNIIYMHRLNRLKGGEDEGVFVSVCIPARNEEEHIGKTVRALLKEDWPRYEILVLDDQSSDRTREIVEEIAREDSRVRVISGRPLPPGWKGKINAMDQLLSQARGDVILFTDADTNHSPDSIRRGMRVMAARNASLVSGFPLELCSTSVGSCISIMTFVTMMWIPLFLQDRIQSPCFAAAIGQYLLVKKKDLVACGGMAALKTSITDDMDMAKLFCRHHKRQIFCDVKSCVSCEMYSRLGDALRGIERSMGGIFGHGRLVAWILLLIAIAGLSCVTASPVLSIVYLVLSGYSLASKVLIIGCFLFWLMFAINTTWHGYRFPVQILGVFTFLCLIYMFFQMAWTEHTHQGFEWKGRKVE